MLGFLPGLFKDEDDEPKFAVAAAAAAAAMLLYLLAKVCFFSGMLLCWDTRAVLYGFGFGFGCKKQEYRPEWLDVI